MLHVGRLKVLCEVARRGSFSGAAEALSYTQSAVSQAIARLEAETGATLIVRDRSGVRPTAAGASLVEHAEGIFARIEAAETQLAAVLGIRAGRLRMASFPSAGATLMPLAIARFRERHPDVALALAEGEPEEIAPRLRAGEFDFALLVALPAEHALAGKRALTLADLGEQDWVQTSASSSCARHVVRSCLAAGFEPKVTFESDDYETVQGLVAAGVGVALIPRLALTHVHPGIVVRSLAPKPPSRRVVAATITAAGVSPAAGTMIEILADVARRYEEQPAKSAA